MAGKAALIVRERLAFDDGALIEIRIWQVPASVSPSTHSLKYSAVYIVGGQRLVGYDNERGKGYHRHIEGREEPYRFVSIERLLADFKADVEALRGGPI
jgi:hypothetical protein